jgi:hypothetical protein
MFIWAVIIFIWIIFAFTSDAVEMSATVKPNECNRCIELCNKNNPIASPWSF